ncbi:WYL domain-containing protein [Kineosporia succinea]
MPVFVTIASPRPGLEYRDPVTRPTSRVLALLEILQSGGTRRVAELAVKLGVDERTVRRYAEHLVELGIPVQSERGRYGGYRLAAGWRMPPLMLTDDEAVAVMIGLVVGRRAGLVPDSTAAESALAKLQRVLPGAGRDGLEALLATAAFTASAPSPGPVETAVLLALASAAHTGHPVSLGYTDRGGRASSRTVRPLSVVGHTGRWYLLASTQNDEQRTFRLDRISSVTREPGSPVEPWIADPAAALLASLAETPWKHEVSFRVRGDVERHLPVGLATVEPMADAPGWFRVHLNAERLDWVPALIAGLGREFVVEEPAELRDLMRDFARRLQGWAG